MTVTRLEPATGNLISGLAIIEAPRNRLRDPQRSMTVRDGAFTDPSPYRAHNARVYRFPRRWLRST